MDERDEWMGECRATFRFYAIVLRIKPTQCCHGEPPPSANQKLGEGYRRWVVMLHRAQGMGEPRSPGMLTLLQ